MTVYITVSHAGTVSGAAVRVVTRKEYSHACYSPTLSLEPLYSFGRIYSRFALPGGFISQGIEGVFYKGRPYTKILVYACEVTPEQKARIDARLAPFIEQPRSYGYGLLNCIWQAIGVARFYPHRFTCSQFVAYLFCDILPFKTHISLVRPMDFCELGLACVFDGTLAEYDAFLATEQKEEIV